VHALHFGLELVDRPGALAVGRSGTGGELCREVARREVVDPDAYLLGTEIGRHELGELDHSSLGALASVSIRWIWIWTYVVRELSVLAPLGEAA
jgi:hypothetical protein